MNLRAQMDQLGSALRDLAPAAWSFFDSLKKEGFTDDQAMDLVKAWLLESLRPKGDSDWKKPHHGTTRPPENPNDHPEEPR